MDMCPTTAYYYYYDSSKWENFVEQILPDSLVVKGQQRKGRPRKTW